MTHKKWLKTSISRYFKERRFNQLDDLMDGALRSRHDEPIKILDVGCASGKDFISFLKNRSDIELYGLDIKAYDVDHDNINFIIGDAEHMDYPDNYFDITVSIGMLEHIQPIEKMTKVIQEIERVSKAHYIVVPSINTIYEPHTGQFFWALRKKRKPHPWLLYFDDRTWLKFQGFYDSKIKRFWYIPGLISNLCIYKKDNK